MMDNLPKSWTSVPLKDIATVFLGKTPARSEYCSKGKYKVVKFRDLKSGHVDFSNAKDGYVMDKTEIVSSLRPLQEKDVLITSAAHSGENIGKKCAYIKRIPDQFECVFFTGELLNIRAEYDEILAKWSYLYFLSAKGFKEIQSAVKGVHLTSGRANMMQIDIAPLSEQRRIVAKLEKLLQKVDACKERLDKIPVILKRFRHSILAAACSGRLTADWREKHPDVEPATELLKRIQSERKKTKKQLVKNRNILEEESFDIPDSWAFCFFEDIAANKPNSLKAGPFGSSLTKSCYVPAGYKIYGQEQVIRGDHSYGDYYIDKEKFLTLKTCEVQAGDILVSLVGTIGKVLIIPDIFEKGIINPRLIKITLFEEVSRKYIARFLSSTLAMNTLSKDSHGGTMDILNMRMLKNLPIPLPPINEQHEIVRRVEALFKIADQIEERYKKARAYVDKLTQSVLAKAFRGELVPQNPNDESVSELLQRIKAGLAKNKAKKKTGRMTK